MNDKLKLVVTFGIGFIISFIMGLFISGLLLDGVTDSKIIIIVNGIVIVLLMALINIPVYLYIIDDIKN